MSNRIWIAGVSLVAGLAGCAAPGGQSPAAKAASTPAPAPATASAAVSPASAPAPAAASTQQAAEFYVVLPEDGRYYAFGSFKLYQDYLAHGEVALTRTRIGAGPSGQTVVFGITKDDVKHGQPSTGERVYDGQLAPAADFYGEVFKGGRYYVFGDLKQLLDFAAHGEVPYSFTDIGAGPNGATIVWVMDKRSYAEGKPTQRMQRFRALRGAG